MNSRKISRNFLKVLPEKVRHHLMRKTVRLEREWPHPELEIKIAETEGELAAAYKLLHDSYVHAGYMNPTTTGMRVLSQHLLPQTTTIVATWKGQVIGTLSLIRDNPFGLPLEKVFDVGARRKNGRRLAEVSSLAVDPAFRGQINTALFPLFRFVYQYARDCFGTHEFVIAVNPSMVDLYTGFMCFERIKSRAKSYDFVKGAPAVGLFMNFETVVGKWEKEFGHRPDTQNFHKYFSEIPTDERNRMPKRYYGSSFDPILTPKLLSDFYLGKAQLANKLSFMEIQVLMNAYPFPEFQKILTPLYGLLSRKSVRLETQMKATIDLENTQAEVLNVSREGLLLRIPSDITLKAGEVTQMNVWLNKESKTRLKVEARWCPANSGLFGCEIIEASKEWHEMIEMLERDYQKLPNIKVAA